MTQREQHLIKEQEAKRKKKAKKNEKIKIWLLIIILYLLGFRYSYRLDDGCKWRFGYADL